MWVLLVFYVTGYAGGVTTIYDFPTEKSCKEAIEQIKDKGFAHSVKGKCVYVPRQ